MILKWNNFKVFCHHHLIRYGILPSPEIKIIYFHSIKERFNNFGFYSAVTDTKKNFSQLLHAIKKNYHPLSLDEFTAIYSGQKKNTRRGILLTFDDGYKDNYEVVLPLVKRYEIPITLFLTTGFIDRQILPYELILHHVVLSKDQLRFKWENQSYKFDTTTDSKSNAYQKIKNLGKYINHKKRIELVKALNFSGLNLDKIYDEFLTWPDLRKMKKTGLVSFGSHMLSHVPIGSLTFSERNRELKVSKSRIEKELCCSIKTLSYPYGEYDPKYTHEISKAGYDFGFITEERNFHLITKENYKIPRFSHKVLL